MKVDTCVWRSLNNLSCLSSSSVHLTWYWSNRLGWLAMNSGLCLCLPAQGWDHKRGQHTQPSPSEELNSGPRARKASALLTEPSPCILCDRISFRSLPTLHPKEGEPAFTVCSGSPGSQSFLVFLVQECQSNKRLLCARLYL